MLPVESTTSLCYSGWVKSLRPVLLGIAASFFFASTFVMNRAMSLGGGSWLWSASLRYLFTLPLLVLIVWKRQTLQLLLRDMRQHWAVWLMWSTIGFGLFYAPLCFAASFGPAWLISGTWQITIVAGSLMAPLLNHGQRLPFKSLLVSAGIVGGIVLMQFGRVGQIDLSQSLLIILPIVLAAFAYPLGNRMMMAHCGSKIDSFTRILGMTIASLPVWLVLSTIALATGAQPSTAVLGQSLLVALFSGIIATVLFFSATNRARHDPHVLAAVEASQSLEVVFALLGELLLLQAAIPGPLAFLGMAVVIGGMSLHSWLVHGSKQKLAQIASNSRS